MVKNDKIERFAISLFYIGKSTDRIFFVLENYSIGAFELRNSNNLMEIYNIVQIFNHEYIDNLDIEIRNRIQSYKEIVIKVKDEIKAYFFNLNADSFVNDYNMLEYMYKEDYFDLFIKYNTFKRFNKNLLVNAITKAKISPNIYLKYEILVDYVDDQLSPLFYVDGMLSELLIDYCVDESNNKKIYIPKSMTKDKRKEVIEKYIDRKDASHYYLQLIIYSMDNNKVNLNDEIKFNAKCKIDSIINAINKEGNIFQFNIMLRSGDNIVEHRNWNKTTLELYYNTKQLREYFDYPTLFNNFIYKFELINFRSLSFTVTNVNKGQKPLFF